MEKSSRIIAATLGIICIILTATLTGTIIQYNSTIEAKELTIDNFQHQIEEKNNSISFLNLEITNKNSQIENITTEKDRIQIWLNNNITVLNNQIEEQQNHLSANQQTIDELLNQNSANQQTIDELIIQNSTNQQIIDELIIQNLTNQQTIIILKNRLDMSVDQRIDELLIEITELENRTEKLESVITFNTSDLETLVFHFSDKADWGPIPDINYTYNEILVENNNTYNIIIFPEFREHQNWTRELEWLNDNFMGNQGIPIMLETFGSSEEDAPITKLYPVDIRTALTKCNIKYLRFAEVISWHLQENITFPTDYVKSMLAFARLNDLEIFWTEWKTDYLIEESEKVKVFNLIQELIEGYEDIVTVSFSTNSGESEPAFGFLDLDEMFLHWGASIQPWYWHTRYGELMDMPISLLIQHTLAAKNIGAEIIQFEPYWYFFDPENGEITENLEILFTMLK